MRAATGEAAKPRAMPRYLRLYLAWFASGSSHLLGPPTAPIQQLHGVIAVRTANPPAKFSSQSSSGLKP